jgi:tetratricopeptide (TPR) repeat protein
MKTADKYIFQALDNYPYWLEGTIESLDYALSYNEKDTTALCLYGRVQSEQLQDYEEAKRYFQEALAINLHAVAVYPYYLDALLWNEDYEEASKLIDFALTIKGTDKIAIQLKKVILLEKQQEVILALKLLKKIKLLVTANDNLYEIEETEKRLKTKKKLLAPKNKTKSEKEVLEKEKKKKGKRKWFFS